MYFLQVAECFHTVEHIAGRIKITQELSALFAQATPIEAQIICYLSLGQLYPAYVHTQFSIAEKTMKKYIAHFLHRSLEDITALAQELGDMGAVVATGHWKSEESLTVMQVYEYLCGLEKITGTGAQEERAHMLIALLKQVTPLEAKYIVRIIIGKLRLGFSDMTIIDALSYCITGDKSAHAALEHAYNVRADIGLLAFTALHDGLEAVKKVVIHVGIPIRPAAAERLPTARAVIEKVGAAMVQPKLDGFRLQIHIKKHAGHGEVIFFSRHLQNMSELFPDLIKPLLALHIEHGLVIEGEAIGFNPETGEFKPFQETVKRKRKHGVGQAAEEFPLQLFLFDLLYLDGVEYLSIGHEKRRNTLLAIMPKTHEKHPLVQVVPEALVDSAHMLEQYWYEAISEGLEGVMIKRPNAVYQAGKRNFNWIKLKRQDEGHLEDTIDAVILGYYTGSGRRTSFGIGAFLVGVYNKHTDRFETVAKVGTGATDVEWKDIKKRSDEFKVLHQPNNVICSPMLAPDVWVTPEIVCKIRADEITLSPVHTAGKTANQAGYALRFPRFMGYAIDKNAYDATTTTEMKRLFEDQKIRQ